MWAASELVGHDTFYATAVGGGVTEDDYVIETASEPEAQAKLAEAFGLFGMCDDAHVIPAGVYLEE